MRHTADTIEQSVGVNLQFLDFAIERVQPAHLTRQYQQEILHLLTIAQKRDKILDDI